MYRIGVITVTMHGGLGAVTYPVVDVEAIDDATIRVDVYQKDRAPPEHLRAEDSGR